MAEMHMPKSTAFLDVISLGPVCHPRAVHWLHVSASQEQEEQAHTKRSSSSSSEQACRWMKNWGAAATCPWMPGHICYSRNANKVSEAAHNTDMHIRCRVVQAAAGTMYKQSDIGKRTVLCVSLVDQQSADTCLKCL